MTSEGGFRVPLTPISEPAKVDHKDVTALEVIRAESLPDQKAKEEIKVAQVRSEFAYSPSTLFKRDSNHRDKHNKCRDQEKFNGLGDGFREHGEKCKDNRGRFRENIISNQKDS